MDTDGQSHQEGDEDDPTVGVRPVGLLVPLGHRPENEGGEQGRHGIDLAFDRGEPERVGEAVCQGSDRGAADNGDGAAGGIITVTARTHETLCKESDGQIQQEYGQGGTQRAHHVDEQRRVQIVPEHREYPGNKLENGVPRGVTYLKFIR